MAVAATSTGLALQGQRKLIRAAHGDHVAAFEFAALLDDNEPRIAMNDVNGNGFKFHENVFVIVPVMIVVSVVVPVAIMFILGVVVIVCVIFVVLVVREDAEDQRFGPLLRDRGERQFHLVDQRL